jgi:hypothetical protein
MNDDETLISILLLDVYRGFSVFDFENKNFYVKHYSVMDILSSEEFYSKCISEAVKSGIKTEKQLLEAADKRGFWTKKDEEKRSSLKWMIGKSEAALEKITDANQKAAFYRQIFSQKNQLEEMDDKRNTVVSYSAEALGEKKKMAFMLKKNIFLDSSLSIPFTEEINSLLAAMILSRISQMSSRSNILKMVYSSNFFDVFVTQYRNPLAMFGKSAFELTVFQKALLSYGYALLNKMKNTTYPESIEGDPVKMFDFKETETKNGKKTEGIDDLKEKMAKNKGKLTAADLLT